MHVQPGPDRSLQPNVARYTTYGNKQAVAQLPCAGFEVLITCAHGARACQPLSLLAPVAPRIRQYLLGPRRASSNC